MLSFWWRRKGRGLDAKQRRVLKAKLGEIDYDLKQIIWDVSRLTGQKEAPKARGTSRLDDC